MRACRLVARGFRNLADLDLVLPPAGAAFMGPNGHGKTSILESLYYPVLFRSFRGAADGDVGRWDGPGFQATLEVDGAAVRQLTAGWTRDGRRKRILLDGEEITRLADAVGRWLAVVFLPADVQLAQGPASGRRQYLDRVLSLSSPAYLAALLRYRGILAQRNAALRAGRIDLAQAFGPGLAEPGAEVVRARLAWVTRMRPRYRAECADLGEPAEASLEYRGDGTLAAPEAWPAALEAAASRERSRGMCLIGPQRDDLTLRLGDHDLREFGSTGQQRTAAIALKLLELATLGEARGSEPALLLDDVFAELDRERQERLAARLAGQGIRQVFVTAPRTDELPAVLPLERFEVRDGRVASAGGPR
jgi:DNA replication and repair protein RecF